MTSSFATSEVLRRIDRTVSEVGRMLTENEDFDMARTLLDNCLQNLQRIRHNLTVDRHDIIVGALQQLVDLCANRAPVTAVVASTSGSVGNLSAPSIVTVSTTRFSAPPLASVSGKFH
jgi:hypothetical protein